MVSSMVTARGQGVTTGRRPCPLLQL
jgi:hypothetical protein